MVQLMGQIPAEGGVFYDKIYVFIRTKLFVCVESMIVFLCTFPVSGPMEGRIPLTRPFSSLIPDLDETDAI